jgi:hypothetical protein
MHCPMRVRQSGLGERCVTDGRAVRNVDQGRELGCLTVPTAGWPADRAIKRERWSAPGLSQAFEVPAAWSLTTPASTAA